MQSVGNPGSAAVSRSGYSVLALPRQLLTIARCLVGMILFLAATDWIWSHGVGLHFTGWGPAIAAVLLLSGIHIVYRRFRYAPPLAELALYAELWVAFTATGCILTYLAAALGRPLADQLFSSIDASIRFDWVAWANFVQAHPAFAGMLHAAYGSLMPQIVCSLVIFSFARATGRNAELLMGAIVALLITCSLSALLPALGPWPHFASSSRSAGDLAYLSDVMTLRQGGPASFSLPRMQGIVCFPSYHTVLAILLVYVHRGLRWSFPLLLVLNGLMLFSIPSEGGHYLADMFGGAATAVCAIGITGWVLAQLAVPATTAAGARINRTEFSIFSAWRQVLKPFYNRRHGSFHLHAFVLRAGALRGMPPNDPGNNGRMES
jgi:hypothetical protein